MAWALLIPLGIAAQRVCLRLRQPLWLFHPCQHVFGPRQHRVNGNEIDAEQRDPFIQTVVSPWESTVAFCTAAISLSAPMPSHPSFAASHPCRRLRKPLGLSARPAPAWRCAPASATRRGQWSEHVWGERISRAASCRIRSSISTSSPSSQSDAQASAKCKRLISPVPTDDWAMRSSRRAKASLARARGCNSNRGRVVGWGLVFESKSEISNPVHIASFASIFHAYGIPDFGKS